MATIERRSGDREGFAVRWRGLDGRNRRRKCPDQRTAIRLAAEIDRLHAQGLEWQPSKVRNRTLISDVFQAYIDYRRVRIAPASRNTEGAHLQVCGRFIEERGIAYLDELSRPVLDDLLGWLLRPGEGLGGITRKPESASRAVMALFSLWRWAEDSGRYPDAPRAPRELDLPRSKPAPVVAPTWTEMDACIAELRGAYRMVATWMRYTGMRVGESMLLEWRDVDMTTGRLTIRPEIDKMRIGRVVPLHPALLDEIATWGKREGYVIVKRGKHRKALQKPLNLAWTKAKVREAAWTGHPDHAFRRGFKSGLLEAGAHADAIDFLQGHSLGAGSRGRYVDGQRLPLLETLAKVPTVGVPGVSRSNVFGLPHRRQG